MQESDIDQAKPEWLGWQAASAFEDASVAYAYRHRPPYPTAAVEILVDLMADHPRTILDVGCGTDYLARQLAPRVDRLDALDISRAMITEGQRLPGGHHPRLRWIVGSAEEADLEGPCALITAGDSLHWMDWSVVLPRFASLLTSQGLLAIVGVKQLPAPWEDQLWAIRRRYSIIPNFQYYDLPQGLADRGLFRCLGARHTEPVPFTQSLDDYIESFHGRATFSRERMSVDEAGAFDDEIRSLVAPIAGDSVALQLTAEVIWGRPLDPMRRDDRQISVRHI